MNADNRLNEGWLVAGRKAGSTKRSRLGRVLLMIGVAIVAYFALVGARLFLFQPKLRVSRETTFVEGPVRDDGTVDFAAAINKEWSKGVTQENNAAVPLARAFGPGILEPEIRETYFELLGIGMPPLDRDYLVSFDEFLKAEGVDEERQQNLLEGISEVKVSEIERFNPEFEAWVEWNAFALEKIIEASGRDRFYSPIVITDASHSLLGASLKFNIYCREAARLLHARSLLRIASGNVDGACADAIACYRLGRIVGEGPMIVGNLIGIAIQSLATDSIQKIVLAGKLSASKAKEVREKHEMLPPPADMAETIDRGERLLFLDIVINGASSPSNQSGSLPGFAGSVIDPNVVLMRANEEFDAWVTALQNENRDERNEKMQELELEMRRSRPKISTAVGYGLIGSRSGLSEQFSGIMISLLFPALESAQAAEDRSSLQYELAKLGLALAEYRAAEGEYPEQLEALRPMYVERLPVDLFSDEALKYRRVGEGILLYSVGPNGRDDGGWSLQEKGESDDVRFGVRPGEEVERINEKE